MNLDNAGNTLGKARDINNLNSNIQTFKDWIGSTDINDFYKFTLSNRTSFNLSVNSLTADADVQIIRDSNSNSIVDNNEAIAASYRGGSQSESISTTLDRGNYYIRVFSFTGNNNTNYNLNVSAAPIAPQDFAGNTINNARQINVDSVRSNFTDWVGSLDTNDYYRFTVNETRNFSLVLSGLTGDANVHLLNSNGNFITGSFNIGNITETINQQLNAGTYFIQILPTNGVDTNYNVAFSATPAAPPDFAGNSLTSFRQINVGSTSSIFTDWVGNLDTNDFYRFTLNETSSLNLTLNGLTADANVRLLDSTGNSIVGSFNKGSANEIINQQLNRGTYFIQVLATNGANTNYNVGISGTPIAPPDFAGNDLTKARQINIGTTNTSFTDWVGSLDTNDYYRFTLNETRNLNLTLNGLTGDANVRLLDSNGNLIIGSFNSGSNNETISRQLNAGTYFIQVVPTNGVNTNYNLNISANPLPKQFNSTHGYGLVNAGSAVARALGQTASLPNVVTNVGNMGGNNWGNDMVNAGAAWTRGFTGQGITVAVIDDGVDIDHEDLRGNVWRNTREIAGNGIDDDGNGYVDDIHGWNFTTAVGGNNGNVRPESLLSNHGTHVAGTIAAMNNGIGVTGVAYNSRIMSLKIANTSHTSNGVGWTDVGNVARAIRYAVDNGARVINMSFAYSGDSVPTDLQDAMVYAANRNVIVVSAAGNNRDSLPTNPARFATQYGFSVGALDRNRAITSFSNRAGNDNRMHHVMAPGQEILSTTPGNTYASFSGTSMAAPHVAGVIALMLSANPNLTHAQVRQILTESATALV
ncbi:MAG: S8 family serine peptidase [Scytonematopsis contorta HA4267-MV1]|jgi:subtilisin family serine protease|nr:S8 family serine peptidase [Scytonematopsis contorta HA4267-MV1]